MWEATSIEGIMIARLDLFKGRSLKMRTDVLMWPRVAKYSRTRHAADHTSSLWRHRSILLAERRSSVCDSWFDVYDGFFGGRDVRATLHDLHSSGTEHSLALSRLLMPTQSLLMYCEHVQLSQPCLRLLFSLNFDHIVCFVSHSSWNLSFMTSANLTMQASISCSFFLND